MLGEERGAERGNCPFHKCWAGILAQAQIRGLTGAAPKPCDTLLEVLAQYPAKLTGVGECCWAGATWRLCLSATGDCI